MSNTANNATVLGINAHNEQRSKQAVGKAQTLIANILTCQANIKGNESAIAEEQKRLAAIADDMVTLKGVVGYEFSGELNMNQITIAKAVEEANKVRQDNVRVQTQAIVNRIDSYQKAIKANNECIEKNRKELSEIAADTVTVAQIVG